MSAAVPKLLQRFRSRELVKALSGWEGSRSPAVSLQNPFIPFFNPKTKRWAPPLYSRRRQAELIKAARATNTLHLIPAGPKLGLQELEKCMAVTVPVKPEQDVSARRQKSRGGMVIDAPTTLNAAPSSSKIPAPTSVKIQWMGTVKEKTVPGADFGARLYAGKKRMFKGHKWERSIRKRRGQIRARMRDMGKRIERFKSTYKRRRPYALHAPKAGKKERMPF